MTDLDRLREKRNAFLLTKAWDKGEWMHTLVRWDSQLIAALEQELKALRWMLDRACVELGVWLPDDDDREGSSSAVHADLESRWTRREDHDE